MSWHFRGNQVQDISIREYNDSTVYEFLNNSLPVGCCRLSFNIPPMNIYDIPHPKKIYRYNPYPLPYTISFASRNYIITLNTPSNPPQVIVLIYDDNNTHHTVMRDNPIFGRGKIGYHYRLHDGIRCYKNEIMLI